MRDLWWCSFKEAGCGISSATSRRSGALTRGGRHPPTIRATRDYSRHPERHRSLTHPPAPYRSRISTAASQCEDWVPSPSWPYSLLPQVQMRPC